MMMSPCFRDDVRSLSAGPGTTSLTRRENFLAASPTFLALALQVTAMQGGFIITVLATSSFRELPTCGICRS